VTSALTSAEDKEAPADELPLELLLEVDVAVVPQAERSPTDSDAMPIVMAHMRVRPLSAVSFVKKVALLG
jgi:hypothetical protein